MPNTYNAEVGEDLTEQLGIIKWGTRILNKWEY